jgi:hypothetical protein
MSNEDTAKTEFHQATQNLKAEIKADAILCREDRDEAHKNLAEGRAKLLTDRQTGLRLINGAVYLRQMAGDGYQRDRLLAYGYLRGRSYKRIESNCRDDNRPTVSDIAFQMPAEYTNLDCIRTWLQEGTLTREQVLQMEACKKEAA